MQVTIAKSLKHDSLFVLLLGIWHDIFSLLGSLTKLASAYPARKICNTECHKVIDYRMEEGREQRVQSHKILWLGVIS